MTVTKSDLVDQMKDRYGYTKKDSLEFINNFVETVYDNMKNGDSVSIYGFGCFDLIVRAERKLPNYFDNNKGFTVPEHWVPRFYPGKEMRRAVKIFDEKDKRSKLNG